MINSEELAPGANRGGPQFMRANFYAESDFVKTDPATGASFNRSGTRMAALTEDFLRGLRSAVVYECGPAADEVFRSAGHQWGQRFAKRFEQEHSEYYGTSVRDFSMAMFQATLVEAFSHHGWGLLTLDFSLHHKGILIATIKNAIMGSLISDAETPVDTLLSGIFSGFFSHFSGQDLGCLQTQCIALGAEDSRFVISLRSRLEGMEEHVTNGKSHQEIVDLLSETKA